MAGGEEEIITETVQECSSCCACVGRKFSLYRHMKMHKQLIVLECKDCRYNSTYDPKNHVSSKHGGEKLHCEIYIAYILFYNCFVISVLIRVYFDIKINRNKSILFFIYRLKRSIFCQLTNINVYPLCSFVGPTCYYIPIRFICKLTAEPTLESF